LKKLIAFLVVAGIIVAGLGSYWASQPIIGANAEPITFTIKSGSGVDASTRQVARDGVPVNPTLLSLLIRLTGRTGDIKAGSYELKPGTTPLALTKQLVRGDFAQESLTVVEGWTFRQMRETIAQHPSLKHDTEGLSDRELMAKISDDYQDPEGLFFPDTYRFARGSSDLQVYKQAHALTLKRLSEAWEKRDPEVPYKSPYEALVMASIVEKETGKEAERDMIAGVFVNRLDRGMLLQTDPTVIYGMGERFRGNITKKDLQTDTAYNTYMRKGLPPTPIALPGAAAIEAALKPATTDALYFVSRGDGSSQFSTNLADHNRAVNRYQR
jgi:UPF0755 protein